jgi:hypothetical protein
MFLFLTLLSFMLNAALCLDLYLTVKNPFVSGKGRTKLYTIVGVSTALFFTVWEIIKVTKREEFVTE